MEKQACSSLPLGAGTHRDQGPPPQKSKNPNQEEWTSTKLPKTEHCAALSAKSPSMDRKYIYKQLQYSRLLLTHSYLREKVCVYLKEKSVRKNKSHSSSSSNELWAAMGSQVAMSLPVFFSFCTRSHIILQKKNNRKKKRRKRKGEEKILKDQYNISSSLCSIMTGKGHLFKFFINLCSCLSSGAELHNKMTIIWVSRGASSCGFQQKDLRASCSWSLMRRPDTWRNSSKSHMGRKVLYFQHNVLPAHGSCRGQTPLWQVLVNQISLTLHNTWYLEIFLFLTISRKHIRHQPVPNQALCYLSGMQV